eukprot:m.1274016 g.1274016  ORF g.1274016 m.1274016 type:complete len:89 (+) comp24756_c0_seq15:3586-3852(+)
MRVAVVDAGSDSGCTSDTEVDDASAAKCRLGGAAFFGDRDVRLVCLSVACVPERFLGEFGFDDIGRLDIDRDRSSPVNWESSDMSTYS